LFGFPRARPYRGTFLPRNKDKEGFPFGKIDDAADDETVDAARVTSVGKSGLGGT